MESTNEKLAEIDAELYDDLEKTFKVDMYRIYFRQEELMAEIEGLCEMMAENDGRISAMVDVLDRTHDRLNQQGTAEYPTKKYETLLNHGKEILVEEMPRILRGEKKETIMELNQIYTEE